MAFISCYTAGFCQWQADVRISNSSQYSYTHSRSVASQGNYVHIAYEDERDGNFEIYYRRSADAGVTWGQETRLTNSSGISGFPCIEVISSTVYLFWHDGRHGSSEFEIYYKFSTDNGDTWSTDTRLTNATWHSADPIACLSGQDVHLTWFDQRGGTNPEVYYKHKLGGGAWSNDNRLTFNNQFQMGDPHIAVSSDSIVHIVWRDQRYSGNMEIFYLRSSNKGISWSTETRLTNASGESSYPTIATTGPTVHVTWEDTRDGNREIYYKRSTDGGQNWGTDTRVTYSPSLASWHPSIFSSGNIIHIVWVESPATGIGTLYYKRSPNAGVTWDSGMQIVSNQSNLAYPSGSASGTAVHAVWNDCRFAALPEVLYKRNPTGNTIGINNISSGIPESFALYQNYPNPFNSNTVISFQIAVNSLTKLIVFDVSGREITSLVNEQLLSGTYQVKFDGSNFSSGIYYYRMETDNFTDTKKLILLK